MENKRNDNDKKNLSEQTRKKLLVYPAFGLVFLLSMYLIFKPSSDTREQKINGFNPELPVPASKELIDNKIDAYEKQLLNNKQNEKNKTLEDFAFPLLKVEEKESITKKQKKSSITAVESYKKMNNELSTIYQPLPKEVKKEKETNNFKEQTDKGQDQYAMLEEAYKLASKYLNLQPQQTNLSSSIPAESKNKDYNKLVVQPDNEKVITYLGNLSDSSLLSSLVKKRNIGFNTISSKPNFCQVNTIKACINNDQVLIFDQSNTQTVTLRLLENVRVQEIYIPRNTLIIAEAKLEGERLQLTVKNIQYADKSIPVFVNVLDINGQKGIYVPFSIEANSAKDIAGNLSGNVGTSINVGNGNAGQQLLADVSRGVIQGATSYLNKKIKVVKVTLKSNYKILLINQQ